MSDLDTAIARARSANVDRPAAERYVRELDRWARAEAAPRHWRPWLAAGFAVGLAAAVVVAVVAPWRPDAAPAVAVTAVTAVRIGDHVAIVAEPGTAYRVVRADATGTEIAIDHGTVTARLWRTDPPHRLALSGGGVTAVATGTIYGLAVGAVGPSVSVVEGAVEVRTRDGVYVVRAGAGWPSAAAVPTLPHVAALTALTPPPPPVVGHVDADADAPAAPAAVADAGVEPRPAVAATAPPIKDRWRTARLLRGQGRFAAALAECVAIADAHDPMWSPIALVEAVRIELGPLADPERSIALADRMVREWPSDVLASEARELRCRALHQLDRGAECGAPASP